MLTKRTHDGTRGGGLRLRPRAAPKKVELRSLAPLSFFLRVRRGLGGALESDLSVPERRPDPDMEARLRVDSEREVEGLATAGGASEREPADFANAAPTAAAPAPAACQEAIESATSFLMGSTCDSR